jgi:hypothetical protein
MLSKSKKLIKMQSGKLLLRIKDWMIIKILRIHHQIRKVNGTIFTIIRSKEKNLRNKMYHLKIKIS